MPYITQEDRNGLKEFTDVLDSVSPTNAGELNYCITRLVHSYLEANGCGDNQGYRYQYFNDAIGALEGAKLELYRRKVAPYEDLKVLENGDV